LSTLKKKLKRDVEKDYPKSQIINKLRRLADCMEQGRKFQIQVAGERITVPSNAVINIEVERGSTSVELEFQLKWSPEQSSERMETRDA
jgi:amphi-Trp domain-containing protein